MLAFSLVEVDASVRDVLEEKFNGLDSVNNKVFILH